TKQLVRAAELIPHFVLSMDNRMEARHNSGLDDPPALTHVIRPSRVPQRRRNFMKHHRRSIHRWAFALALAFFAIEFGLTSLLAQGGAIVRSIDVQYAGPKTVSREKILSQIRTTVGQPYSDDVVEQD